jgi:hypothetical protein
MTEKLDKKFYPSFSVDVTGGIAAHLMKAKDHSVVGEDEYVVFLAKDNAFAAMLPFYVEECNKRGCDQAQQKAAMRLLNDVRAWRREHPERCKDPDAAGETLLP